MQGFVSCKGGALCWEPRDESHALRTPSGTLARLGHLALKRDVYPAATQCRRSRSTEERSTEQFPASAKAKETRADDAGATRVTHPTANAQRRQPVHWDSLRERRPSLVEADQVRSTAGQYTGGNGSLQTSAEATIFDPAASSPRSLAGRSHEGGPFPLLSPEGSDTSALTVASSFGYPPAVAPLRWLDLLALDAAQSDVGFSYLRGLDSSLYTTNQAGQGTSPNKHSSIEREPGLHSVEPDLNLPGRQIAADSGTSVPFYDNRSSLRASSLEPTSEENVWQATELIELQDHEIPIFRNFVDRLSHWLDVFDPMKHFSTYVPHLALRNICLMKALLALSARHLSLSPGKLPGPRIDRNVASQYYYETLQYLYPAMASESFKRSEELVATALIISFYEMIDGSESGWERHLKGVFWIQRSQGINGDTGGLKEAVWWAWLRQDVWAAFRERRRAYTLWKPPKPYNLLNKYELASRSIYLLAQTVNYCSDEEIKAGEGNLQARIKRASVLWNMLEEWRGALGADFEPLPQITRDCENAFKPICIHPPAFGLALQMHAGAQILLMLHRPSSGGLHEYASQQKMLAKSVNTICGIALTLQDDFSSVVSSQCLFYAGMCVQHPNQRQSILDLIEQCRQRTGWPVESLTGDLQEQWNRTDHG
ncbi:MAG: hypothetical protein M1837_005146 [Sclerophora amabilis]|nr:MAG: hypothetical protein M1837_005146 [Sclerophora amabilis]